MVSLFKNERIAMAFAAMEYPIYTFFFVYVIPWVCIIWSVVHGFAASVFWACQGVYLSLNSSDENRGRRAGIFWSIYMMGAVFGNVCAYILMRFMDVQSGGGPGWNGSTSILFIFLGTVSMVGPAVLFKLKPSQEVMERQKKNTILRDVQSVLKLLFTPKMLCLVPLFCCLGFQSIFVNSMYNRQIVNKSDISLYMIVYTVVEVFAGFLHGWCIDKIGLFPMLIGYLVLGASSLALAYYANAAQNLLFLPLYVLFSLTDSGFQTFCLTVVGKYFKDNKTIGNAIFRMFQSLGGGICYLTGQLFVDEGAASSTPQQLLQEIVLCLSFFVLCFIFYTVFYFMYEKRNKPTSELLQTLSIAKNCSVC